MRPPPGILLTLMGSIQEKMEPHIVAILQSLDRILLNFP